ncbi:MAG: transposase [Planctomycetota bacterium]|nr:transposase [Planctomycetota bacterium]
MRQPHYIAMDTHCETTDTCAMTFSERIILRERCPTTIPTLRDVLEKIPGPRILTFEEGPLADWLSRQLTPFVDRLIVCEPRRNALISKDGDKDDAIDAEKLARLLRSGMLKEVHQTHTLERSILKQHVSFYHDRVRERVRQGLQLVSLLRRHGVFVSVSELLDADERRAVWKRLPQKKLLLQNLDLVWGVYELMLVQEAELKAQLPRLGRREETVRRFQELPGFGWIRALTAYVYLDTPLRFRSKQALWKYSGIGLERHTSGKGRPRVYLVKKCYHRALKNVFMGAAKSAIGSGDNPFAEKYDRWTQEAGLHPATARRNVARCLATTLWSLWKDNSRYDPAHVR